MTPEEKRARGRANWKILRGHIIRMRHNPNYMATENIRRYEANNEHIPGMEHCQGNCSNVAEIDLGMGPK